MASINSFGRQAQDLEFGTLSCNGSIIIDRNCNMKINDLKVNGTLTGGGVGNKVYFTATLENAQFIPENSRTPILYDNVTSNTGVNYDLMTGIITIITPGVYQIHALTNLYPLESSYIESRIITSPGTDASFTTNSVLDEALNSMAPSLALPLVEGDEIYVDCYHKAGMPIPLATGGNTNICLVQL
jgi:hypothetical protein